MPLSWLRQYVEFDLEPRVLAEKLTSAGLAVEGIEDLSAPVRGIVVGRILELRPHAKADKLLLAETDCGHGVITLVTAAVNLKAGDLVPVAPPGTVLPSGLAIQARSFAGVTSEGMLCSAAELGLEKRSEGIMVLEGDWPPGSPIAPAIGLDEVVLEIELTPNRADCLGLLGVAREVSALTGGRLMPPPAVPREEGPAVEGLARVFVEDQDLCPRYAGKVFLDVTIAPSPLWMQKRLRAAGIRPINNLVDITNYVMYELNQPLHAFDLDRLSERTLIIRRAKRGETIRTLDEADRSLPPGALAITDPSGPVAVAGVMGGASSEVTDETKRVFLEGAYFDRVNIRRTAKALAMRTEASIRFERGIDMAAVAQCLDRAAFLLEEIGAGQVARGTLDVAVRMAERRVIETSARRLNALLGTDFDRARIGDYLRRLGFAITNGRDDSFTAEVPTYRIDVEGPADLAEEIARLHGYDRIPVTYPAGQQVGRRTVEQETALRARRILRGLGQTEIITYSFCSPRLFEQLGLDQGDPAREALRILSPLSEEWTIMRPLLLGGILETLATNARRGVTEAAVFELARVYQPSLGRDLPEEPQHLAGGLMGIRAPRSWAETPRPYDFYDLKGLIESFLEHLGLSGLRFAAAPHPSLHPGRSAALLTADGATAGFIGEAHPRVLAAFDLKGPIHLYELDFDRLFSGGSSVLQAKSLPRFPAVLRDLALVVPADLSWEDLDDSIRELGGAYLEGLQLFDVYAGAQVDEGQKSLAFSLVMRAEDRTLTDREANEILDGVIAGLQKRYGAAIRS